MKNKISLYTFTILTLLFITSCNLTGKNGSGIKESETRTLSAFTTITSDIVVDINVIIGETQSVTVTGDDNLLSIINTKVTDGKLRITSSEEYNTNIGIDIDIVVADLTHVDFDGVGDIDITGINNTDFDIEIDGVGNGKVSGTTTNLVATLDGVGDLELYGLKAENADVDLDGVGSIEVYASLTLKVELNGVGDIHYKGDASITSINLDGVGDIKNKN